MKYFTNLFRSPQRYLDYDYSFSNHDLAYALKVSILVWAVSRALIFILTYVSISIALPISNENIELFSNVNLQKAFYASSWTGDSGWYQNISLQGYSYESRQSPYAYFPAYPILWWALGTNLLIVLTHIIFIIGLVGLHQFCRIISSNKDIAFAATCLICFFPTTQALSSLRPEAIMLCCWIWSLLTFKRKPLLCFTLVTIGSFTKPNAFLIIILLLPLFMGLRINNRKSLNFLHYLPLVGAFLGPIVFSFFCYVNTGDFLAWSNAQKGWGAQAFVVPAQQLMELFTSPDLTSRWGWDATIFNWAFFALALYASIYFAKTHPSISLFIIGLSLLSFVNFGVWVHGRHISCAFPIFLCLASTYKNHISYSLTLLFFSFLLSAYVVFQTLGINAFSA